MIGRHRHKFIEGQWRVVISGMLPIGWRGLRNLIHNQIKKGRAVRCRGGWDFNRYTDENLFRIGGVHVPQNQFGSRGNAIVGMEARRH